MLSARNIREQLTFYYSGHLLTTKIYGMDYSRKHVRILELVQRYPNGLAAWLLMS
jgi:hypothetical protein